MVAIRPTLVRQATVVATLETLAAALSTVAAHSFAGTGSLPARVPAVQFGVAHGPTSKTKGRLQFDKVIRQGGPRGSSRRRRDDHRRRVKAHRGPYSTRGGVEAAGGGVAGLVPCYGLSWRHVMALLAPFLPSPSFGGFQKDDI